MNKLGKSIFCAISVLFFLSLVCVADTFENIQTEETFDGYIKNKREDGTATVQSKAKGLREINLSEWKITANRKGRKNQVAVIPIDKGIELEIETQAFEEAIVEIAEQGPLFILLEIDTPGGFINLATRMCAAIDNPVKCPIVAFIKGGEYGGAISAGAAISLACDKIYMVENTSIGAAAVVTFDEQGKLKGIKEVHGQDAGEKLSSYWKGFMASLAEKNNRPALLARAMIDKEIEVVEVSSGGERLFIDPAEKKQGQQAVHTWSKKGSLLTLTASEAVKCGIADGIVSSREQLLVEMNALTAQIIINNKVKKAGTEYKRVELRLKQLRKKLDLNIKKVQLSRSRTRALGLIRRIRDDFKDITMLAKRYPDLKLDVIKLENELNDVEAAFAEMKVRSGRRR